MITVKHQDIAALKEAISKVSLFTDDGFKLANITDDWMLEKAAAAALHALFPSPWEVIVPDNMWVSGVSDPLDGWAAAQAAAPR